MEEGKVLAAAELVARGSVPHRDFEHIYGPGDVYALGVAFALASPSVAVERTVGLAAIVVLVGSTFAMSARAGPLAAAGAGLISGSILIPFGLHAYSWLSGLALAAAAVVVALHARDAAGPRSHVLAAVAGVCAAVALFYRADLLVAVGGAAVVLLPTMAPRIRRMAAVGFAVGLVPYMAHVAVAGPGRVFAGMVRDPLLRLRDGRRLPVPPPGDHLAGWLEAITPGRPALSYWTNPSPAMELRWTFLLTLVAAVAIVGLGVAAVRQRGWQKGAAVLAPAALAVGLLPQMLQRADSVHVRFVACVMLALVPMAVAWGRQRRALAAAAAALVVVAAASLLAPQLAVGELVDVLRQARSPAPLATHGARAFPMQDEATAAHATAAVEAAAAAAQGGEVYVGTADLRLAAYGESFLYHLLLPEVAPASYFLEFNPGTSNRRGSRLADDIAGAEVVVLSRRFIAWDEPNTSARRGDDAPVQVLRREFRRAGSYGPYEVFERDQ